MAYSVLFLLKQLIREYGSIDEICGIDFQSSSYIKENLQRETVGKAGASIALIKDRLTPAFSACGATRWGIIRSSATVSYTYTLLWRNKLLEILVFV